MQDIICTIKIEMKGLIKMKVALKADNIRKILAQRNISQNWLAFRVGTTSGYISQMMTGKRNPSPKMRKKILKVLKDCEFEDLFKL